MNNRDVPQVVEPETAPPAHGVMGRPTATEQGVPGGRRNRTQTQAPAPVAVKQPGIDKGNTDEDTWEAATWKDIEDNHRGDRVPIAAVDRRQRTRIQDKLRDQQRASH
jgi:hypothetical protein